MKLLRIIKIGGNVIDDSHALERFLRDLAILDGFKILIHGGGKIATKLSAELGIKSRMVEGRRITDAESLDVVTMVYAGLISKRIVAGLQARNCNAIGLTGADGNIIRAKKRPLVTVGDEDIDFGFVGDLDKSSVNSQQLRKLLEAGFIPVFSAITHDGNGQLLNTNADTVASVLAVSMAGLYETSLIYCFEKQGVLQDINDDGSVIPCIYSSDYIKLKSEGIINAGMIPKLDNAFDALEQGVREVWIGRADALPLLEQQNFGTRLINK